MNQAEGPGISYSRVGPMDPATVHYEFAVEHRGHAAAAERAEAPRRRRRLRRLRRRQVNGE